MAKGRNKPKKGPETDRWIDAFQHLFAYANQYVKNINDSKIFAGIMIILLNIGSKFVTIKLSPSMESYLKYTFSRQILVFAIAWMGTRDIYIALTITIIFAICVDYLFNENSALCCLPEAFTQYHIDLLEENGPNNLKKDDKVTEDEIRRAQEVLEKAKRQNVDLNYKKLAKYN